MRKRQCPACGQFHFKRAEVIYESGTRTGISRGPKFDISYHNQSAIAARYEPPQFWYQSPHTPDQIMLTFFYLALVGVLCSPASWYVAHWNEVVLYMHEKRVIDYLSKHWVVFSSVIGGFVITYIGLSKIYETEVQLYQQQLMNYHRAYEAWQNTWVCMDCGHEMI